MGVFPLIVVINQDAVSFAVALLGTYGARTNNETAKMLTARMSETPVFITWRRRDVEMPHLRPRRSHWVVNTLSRRSSPYESGSLDLDNCRLDWWVLKIATPRPANRLSAIWADEIPQSGDSYLQVCSRRSADELLESADP